MPSKRLTAFSWGYWGWGNAAERFAAAVDACEAERGFRPPLFVDVRYHRAGRAKKFHGDAFAGIVGAGRYEWMKELGNQSVSDGGSGFRIAQPAAAEDLLDLVEAAEAQDRRVLFFCGCQYAAKEGKDRCHRRPVARLLLKAAALRKRPLTVVDWPGDRPQRLSWKASADELRRVRKGQKSLLVRRRLPLPALGALPPFSMLDLGCGDERERVLVAAPFHRGGEWQLRLEPLQETAPSAEVSLQEWSQHGYEPLTEA